MRKIYFILPALFFIQSISYANSKPINSVSELDTAIQISLSEDDSRTALAANDWFYINVYGGLSYKAFPKSEQAVFRSDVGTYDIYQPAKRYSPYFAAEFGIRPWRYLTFGIRYWNTFNTDAQLRDSNGKVKFPNGDIKMSFSGINILVSARLPLPAINSEVILSSGPAIIFSQFNPTTTIASYDNPALKKINNTNIRPFVAVGYQYLLPYSLTLGLEAQYIFGIGKDVYSPYYGSSYVPNIFNLSLSIGYHF
ncbi:hypothetical protein [Cysteiniphilum halobium]|uniref:hypothetical protein n=1 Tax=Cysteiniphilum halobium TaxID=2219059 RepID=UPI000E6475CF|nr:hypothetical protein [Cysteiniphilum halobium]